ncbi:RRXRR domain-containing protein [Streptomyces sp. NPDC058289]|uniref:RRXRR domain-containing protein n=1 Tax=Streptomyces sp. NPDC058289 TaxID=3346425 RepID=UPI0036E56A07
MFVLDEHGLPLQPTWPARARKLLHQGRAVVARHTPFLIRLKDRTARESQVDGVELGSNRTRPEGWLAPSLRHRVDTTVAWTTRLAHWAPVRSVHVERVALDTHAMSRGGPLEGAEYQHGTLRGTEVREYLLAPWGRACAYCGAEVPLNIDHIHPKSRGGSSRISNGRTKWNRQKNFRLLQRADGYAHTTRPEGPHSPPATQAGVPRRRAR